MPSRRTLLTALVSVTAGCSIGSGGRSPSDTPTRSRSPSSTEAATVSFDPVVTQHVPTDAPILVTSPTWRRWLEQATGGTTVRGAADPPNCGRAPLSDAEQLRLVDTEEAGTYDLNLEDGGYYEYQFDVARTGSTDDATVYDLGELRPAVADRLADLLDAGGGRLVPQSAAFQFVDENARESGEYTYLLYVRRNDTVYRVSAETPTITPPCGYYVVMSLAATGSASELTTLSLADLESLGALDDALDRDTTRSLASFQTRTRELLRRFDYVLGLTQCYRVVVDR